MGNLLLNYAMNTRSLTNTPRLTADLGQVAKLHDIGMKIEPRVR